MPTLKAGIAAAQLADIFVGPHGANIANAWLMRPGSSVVEVTMFGFDESTAHINLAARNAKVGAVAVAVALAAAIVGLPAPPSHHTCQRRVSPLTPRPPLPHPQDAASEVQFWKLLLCDPKGSWEPSAGEVKLQQEGKPIDPLYAKYRNSIVR